LRITNRRFLPNNKDKITEMIPYSCKLEKVTDAKVTQLALFGHQNDWHYVHQVVILKQLRN
jgi:hypothetical protein